MNNVQVISNVWGWFVFFRELIIIKYIAPMLRLTT